MPLMKNSRNEWSDGKLTMSERIVEMLTHLRTERPAIAGFVFTHSSGKQIWTQQLSSAFKAAAREVGLPQAKFHHLRHSMLHDLSEAGATTREVGALAGHKCEKSSELYIGRWSKAKVREIATLRNAKKSD